MIYFDAAATTLQKPPAVAAAVERAIRTCASPGRGGYAASRRASEAVYRTRELAAELFSCEPEQVSFTLNATHALNLAIRSLVPQGGRVVTSGFEHNAVVRPIYALDAELVPAGRTLFDPEQTLRDFAEALQRGADCAICTQVSNVFGYVLPLPEIAALCRKAGVPLIVDASQGAGVLPLDAEQLDAAFIAMPGHKSLYGPQGTGLLITRTAAEPLLYGGTGSQSRLQEMPEELPERLEAGTLNVAGICGLEQGLRFVAEKTPERIFRHEQNLLRRVTQGLARLHGVRCFTGEQQSGVLSVALPGLDCELVADALSQRGIAVRAGLHCAPMAHESAGTLEDGTLRVSFSAFNTPRETDEFVKVLRILVESDL